MSEHDLTDQLMSNVMSNEQPTDLPLDPMSVARRNRDAAMAASQRPHEGPHVPLPEKGTEAAALEEARVVQGLAEGADPDERIEFMGKWFRISHAIGLMPLMKFAAAADSNIDTADMAALAAIYAMLKDCIYEGNGKGEDEEGYDAGDWGKFEAHAIATKAEAEDMLPVTQQVIEILTARPTRPRSGS
jgi:hypothetical protein